MTRLLMFALPFALVTLCWLLAAGRPRITRVSKTWIADHERVQVRTVGRVEHELLVDGKVVARSESEDYVRAVKAEILRARGGEA